jgi:hypothetical protein
MPAPKIIDTATEPAEGLTRCTVTRLGAGKISTGERVDNVDQMHPQGAVIELPDAIVLAHEARNFVAVI